MKWTNVKLIFLREIRDQLRDRRTLFMIVVLPLVLYPALGLGLLQLTIQFGRERRTIGISGYEFLPKAPPLLEESEERFSAQLFKEPENQKYYEVKVSDAWTSDDLRARRIDLLVRVPPDTPQRLEEGEQVELQVLRNAVDDRSELAYAATRSLLEAWEERFVEQRMQGIGRTASFADPIEVNEENSDVSSVEERSGTVWSRIVPFVLVMMALTGAFYPAIDLCAGEKERGTMETLLITPASRGEIVAGKFLTILSFSVGTTIFNLVSMGLTFGHIASVVRETAKDAGGEFAPPQISSIVWMLVLMLPLAAFFSALCMALAVFARSTKEGQYYLMPLFLVVVPLIFLTMAPGIGLNAFYSLMPVTNIALLLRAFMLNQYDVAFAFLLPVLGPTVLYSYLALRFALDQFHREEVLFREAERVEVGLWIRRMLETKPATPTSAQAWACYVLMLVLMWYGQGSLPARISSIGIVQLALIAFPVLLFSLLLTAKPRATLGLNPPLIFPSILAILLVFTLHPVVIEFGQTLEKNLPLREDLKRGIEQLIHNSSLTERLIYLGLFPAICEELAFRGFILSGLRQRHPPMQAIGISSVLFGIFHLIPQQMIVTTILGFILGLMATRTGSILPGMLFHGLHNSLAVLYSQLARDGSLTGHVAGAGYDDAFVIMSGLASALLIGTLASMKTVDLRSESG